mmetsp:Transcript_41400/g.107247  ORF Transcript_41400/g.107247 Transcript_41400/m.107247 type:complete len:231 (-) Transcript_41400:885-1577(-)
MFCPPFFTSIYFASAAPFLSNITQFFSTSIYVLLLLFSLLFFFYLLLKFLYLLFAQFEGSQRLFNPRIYLLIVQALLLPLGFSLVLSLFSPTSPLQFGHFVLVGELDLFQLDVDGGKHEPQPTSNCRGEEGGTKRSNWAEEKSGNGACTCEGNGVFVRFYLTTQHSVGRRRSMQVPDRGRRGHITLSIHTFIFSFSFLSFLSSHLFFALPLLFFLRRQCRHVVRNQLLHT